METVQHEHSIANIVPMHKGGDIEEPLNYKPVSLTNIVAKICEKRVKDRWLKFSEETNTLSWSVWI